MNPRLRTLALSLLFCVPSAAQAANKPNILWLIAEDMGPSLSCYGNKEVSTPNIDRLASEGVRYTRAYTTAPVCSASRSSFMTGMQGNDNEILIFIKEDTRKTLNSSDHNISLNNLS